jgi:hypothetical protein
MKNATNKFLSVANRNIRPLIVFLLVAFTATKTFATAWTTVAAGPVTTLANWSDGTVSPSNFLAPGDTWTIAHAMTIASPTIWTVGSLSSSSSSVTFATGGSLAMSGAGGTTTINIYGDMVLNGGTLTIGGAGTTENLTVDGDVTINAGIMNSIGSSTNLNITSNGLFSVGGGTVTPTGAGSGITINNTGDFVMTGGAFTASSDIFLTINGNSTISGGTLSTSGASSVFTMEAHGNFTMTGGTFTSGGAGSDLLVNIYGNCSYSGTCAMTSTGAGTTSNVHLKLPASSGNMLIDNTSTGSWSKTTIYIDAGSVAELAGNFSTTTGANSGGFGLIDNGTLICPAAFVVNGLSVFQVNSGAKLVTAHGAGINGSITTTGTKTFNSGASYTYNGTVAQVTGTYLPASLITPSVLTISNNAGVTLSQTTATTGTLAFTAGILHTGAFTMSTPGTAGAVTGAGLTSYVNGTLIKTISALTSVNYEVGDLSYAPMLLTFSSAGSAGSIGLKTTNGLHPSVATSGLSSSNMANHYWTITDYGSAGPATVIPKATYNAADILGGSNAAFVTQQYAASAWLVAALPTTNTSAPYTSAPNTGISLATLPGAYIFGNPPCGTLPITGTPTVCVTATTALADATPGGTWSSGTPAVATVSATGIVTGVSAGTTLISYTATGCTETIVVTVNPAPDPGTITGVTAACIGFTTSLTSSGSGGTWSSTATGVATVSATGVVAGISSGTAIISYTVTNSCGTAAAVVTVSVSSTLSVAPITGIDSVCPGQTITLTDATGGGVWTSTNTAIATVSTSGVVTGIAPGYDTIVYTITNSCGTASAKLRIKVRSLTACPSSLAGPAAPHESGLVVFPNPNNGTFTVKMNSTGNAPVQIIVTDMTGRFIANWKIPDNVPTELSANLPHGVYILSATSGNERYFKKVVVQ